MQCSGNEEQHWGDSTDTRTDYNGFYGNCIYGYKNYGILATGASYTFLSYNKNVSWSTGST
ncbi:hypothetical protein FACS1894166_12900 [Bacilli bacterium]|nr:hypothetical protein FACS1894166_12900 [Bacilli bacterium]